MLMEQVVVREVQWKKDRTRAAGILIILHINNVFVIIIMEVLFLLSSPSSGLSMAITLRYSSSQF